MPSPWRHHSAPGEAAVKAGGEAGPGMFRRNPAAHAAEG